ncbi:unnamed protein product [Adineta ricciae]|uniref:CHK kinase-like domain-containing protein n=1 Tax=Adineta ricciae TaxID=249248 RepID=A0A814DWS3_ADIRI|nr:unnamed protein product [Adineta ricciae]CAF1479836.1 unnamed protein product [Adineta ricciae]
MSTTDCNLPLPIKTFLEPNEIWTLPQHRLKARRTNLIPTICFYNGSFAPIHAGHVNVLQSAKQYIDSLGTHELLAAYMSPSHSEYLAAKLNSTEFLSIGHRLAMIHLAVENLDWVMVDLYETFQTRATRLGIIMDGFMKRVRSQLPDGNEIDVFWLKGEDALRFPPMEIATRLGFQHLYVLNRNSNEKTAGSNQDKRENQWQKKWTCSSFPERFHLFKATDLNLSSTAIRRCASEASVTHEQLQLCTHLDNITSYILRHHLWCSRKDAMPLDVSSAPVFSYKIEDLTPESLSEMVSKSSNVPVEIVSYESERIGEGKGWGGPIYRLFNIQYSSVLDNSLPSSMILKLSTGIWNGHVASSEPEFYLNLAPRISHIQVPRFYYAARSADNPNASLLLLEDLSMTHKAIVQRLRFDDRTLCLLVATIATLHAEFFEHPILLTDAFAWLPSLNSVVNYYQPKYTQRINSKPYQRLLERKLSSKAVAYANGLSTYIPYLFQALSSERFSLAHGDFWKNNVLLQDDHPHRLVLLDWQTCCRANGLLDVAYFLRLLGSEQARSLEPQLLEIYHQTLIKYGISRYSLADIRKDYYSLALPYMFVFFVCWDANRRDKMSQTAFILEDIINYSGKP